MGLCHNVNTGTWYNVVLKWTSKLALDASNSESLNPTKSLYFYSEALKKNLLLYLVDMETFSTTSLKKIQTKITKISQCQNTKRKDNSRLEMCTLQSCL